MITNTPDCNPLYLIMCITLCYGNDYPIENGKPIIHIFHHLTCATQKDQVKQLDSLLQEVITHYLTL